MSYPTTIFQAQSVLEAEGKFFSGDMIKQFESLQPRLFWKDHVTRKHGYTAATSKEIMTT